MSNAGRHSDRKLMGLQLDPESVRQLWCGPPEDSKKPELIFASLDMVDMDRCIS